MVRPFAAVAVVYKCSYSDSLGLTQDSVHLCMAFSSIKEKVHLIPEKLRQFNISYSREYSVLAAEYTTLAE